MKEYSGELTSVLDACAHAVDVIRDIGPVANRSVLYGPSVIHFKADINSPWIMRFRMKMPCQSTFVRRATLAVVCTLVVGVTTDLQLVRRAMAQESVVTFRGEIVDADSGQPLAARIYVQSMDGKWYFPRSASPDGTALELKKQNGPKSVEQHVTLSAHPFIVDVPPGRYSITVERGKEWIPTSREITIDSAGKTKTDGGNSQKFPLRRWINMAERGWYSGDIHSHRPLPDMPNLVLAEDVNVATPLSHWVTAADTDPTRGNRISTPVPQPEWIAVDRTHGIYPLNTEYEVFTVGGKAHTLGAVLICGQRTLFDKGVPPVKAIAEQAHAEGAFLDLEKHSWAWSPMIVPIMKVDLFELSNNHCWRTEFGLPGWTLDAAGDYMKLEKTDKGFTEWGWIEFGLKSYYAYLNCGFRMMPSAGTGAGVHPVPFGFSRVYVKVPGEFTFTKWREGLLAGRSFVTTGPMMSTLFNGQESGSTINLEKSGQSVRVTATIESLSEIDRIEIIRDGDVVWSIKPAQSSSDKASVVNQIDQMISFESSGWIAVRCFEKHPEKRVRFAHSAPVFVSIPNHPQSPKRVEVEHFMKLIEKDLQRHQSVLSASSLDEFREAHSIYKALLLKAK